MLLKFVKNRIPLKMRQQFRPYFGTIPVVKGLLSKPFYQPSDASVDLARDLGMKAPNLHIGIPSPTTNAIEARKMKLSQPKPDPVQALNIDPLFFKKNFPTTLKFQQNENYLILGSKTFLSYIQNYHERIETLAKERIGSLAEEIHTEDCAQGVYYFNGKKDKLKFTFEQFAENSISLKVIVDFTNYYKSVDILGNFRVLAEMLNLYPDISADITLITSLERKEDAELAQSVYFENAQVQTHYISVEQALCLRTSNPFMTANRHYRGLLGKMPLPTTLLVLGWKGLLTNPQAQKELADLARAYPDTDFKIFEPIWDLPLNAKTDIADLPSNCYIEGSLGFKQLIKAGGCYNAVYCVNGIKLPRYERGQAILFGLLLQGLPIFGDVKSFLEQVNESAGKYLTGYIHEGTSELGYYLQKLSLSAIEEQLSQIYSCITEWPQTIFETLLPLPHKEVSVPINWKQGRVVITTHRLTYLDNIVQNIRVCNKLGLPITVVMNNLSQEDADHIKLFLTNQNVKCDYFQDDKYSLGYGITQAVIQSGSDYWMKIDDDDIYTAGHFLEIYTALRLFQIRYAGRRIAFYNDVLQNNLYAHENGQVMPSINNGRFVSGACMSGLTSLLKDYEISRYSFYNMDVTYSRYLQDNNEPIFIGTSFFLYVQRYGNSAHTWQLDLDSWIKECKLLGSMRTDVRDDFFKHQANAHSIIFDKKPPDVCFIHRAIPGTIGYGAGTWVPHEAMRLGLKITEVVLKETSPSVEPIVTQFPDRDLVRFDLTNIDVPSLKRVFNQYIKAFPKVFHILNMEHIGIVAQFIKKRFPKAKIVIEARTPLLSKNEHRRIDMSIALKLADSIVAASQKVLETWLTELDYAEISEKVSYVEPSIHIPDAVDLTTLKTSNKNTCYQTDNLRLIYNGSIANKRKIPDLIDSIKPALESDTVTLSLCITKKKFDRKYPKYASTKNLKFIGLVSNTQMFDTLSQHDILLAWLPMESLYEEAWSTKIVEAAAIGLSVIGSNTKGHHDMMARGLFKNIYDNTPESFMDALVDLCNQTPQDLRDRKEQIFAAARKCTWRSKIGIYADAWGATNDHSHRTGQNV